MDRRNVDTLVFNTSADIQASTIWLLKAKAVVISDTAKTQGSGVNVNVKNSTINADNTLTIDAEEQNRIHQDAFAVSGN